MLSVRTLRALGASTFCGVLGGTFAFGNYTGWRKADAEFRKKLDEAFKSPTLTKFPLSGEMEIARFGNFEPSGDMTVDTAHMTGKKVKDSTGECLRAMGENQAMIIFRNGKGKLPNGVFVIGHSGFPESDWTEIHKHLLNN